LYLAVDQAIHLEGAGVTGAEAVPLPVTIPATISFHAPLPTLANRRVVAPYLGRDMGMARYGRVALGMLASEYAYRRRDAATPFRETYRWNYRGRHVPSVAVHGTR